MDNATMSMLSLIGLVKENLLLSKESAEADLAKFYPVEECTWRLDVYIQAMFSVGSVGANSWPALRDYIYGTPVETLQRIMPNVREIADRLIVDYSHEAKLLARKAVLETILAQGNPSKTEPDVEAMEFWNMMSHEVMEYDMAQVELESINQQLGG